MEVNCALKVHCTFCKMMGNRREHMPAGIYIEIHNAPSDSKFLVSDKLGTKMGFKLHRREVTLDSNVSIYRLIGYYAETKYVAPEDVIKYNFRNATEEEIKTINHYACLT